jgi:DNA-binding MarR family transcriptional regulator
MTRYVQGAASSPGFLLWHVTLHWQRTITAALAPLELTHVRFVLLACTWWLETHGDLPNQLELARQAGTEPKMTSQVVRKLEAQGLVHREVDASDTRARRISLTSQGRSLARRAIAVVEQADLDFFGREAKTMTPLLQRLAARNPRAVDIDA